ncbi:MAG: hypothetical protein WKF74_10805 [Pyrinomonadaceae bacterium]
MALKARYVKTVLVLFSVSVLALLLLGRYSVIQPALAQQEAKRIQKWEYCTFSGPYLSSNEWATTVEYFRESGTSQYEEVKGKSFGTAFAKLGADGWELVGISNEDTGQLNTRYLIKRAR